MTGDGYPDVVAGSPFSGTGGNAFVFFGAAGLTFDSTADGSLPGQMGGEAFGYYVAR